VSGVVSGTSRLAIDIHFDLICPWCFIGKRQLTLARSLLADRQPGIVVALEWHPRQLLPDVPEEGVPFAAFYERRLGSPEAVWRRQQQVVWAAREVGLDLDLARIQRMPNTARAHRLLRRVAALRQPALYEALLDRMFAAYFQRGEDIGDASTLWMLAGEVGVPAVLRDDTTPGDASPPPGSTIAGVPHFVFNGRLSVSGAQAPAILFAAMYRAVQSPVAPESA
jgi:predicted DsbA family dithiol-disulfide isomerase